MFPPCVPYLPSTYQAHLLNCLFVIKITISGLSSYYNTGSLRYLKVNTFPLSPLFNLCCHRGEDMVIKRRGRHLLAPLAAGADLKNIKSHRKLNIGSLSITPAGLSTDWEGEFENYKYLLCQFEAGTVKLKYLRQQLWPDDNAHITDKIIRRLPHCLT